MHIAPKASHATYSSCWQETSCCILISYQLVKQPNCSGSEPNQRICRNMSEFVGFVFLNSVAWQTQHPPAIRPP